VGRLRERHTTGQPFLSSHPDIRLICFNGAKAATLFKAVVPTLEERWAHVRRVTLPSTSPAFASMPLADKIEMWRDALNLRRTAP
jgi:G:T/U-mismatch repair DNA glycosylase